MKNLEKQIAYALAAAAYADRKEAIELDASEGYTIKPEVKTAIERAWQDGYISGAEAMIEMIVKSTGREIV